MNKLKYGTVEKIGGTSYWKVVTPFFWYIDYDEKGWRIEAPKGLITNYGSIPRIFRVFFDPTKFNSFVIHDQLYNDHYAVWDESIRYVSRKEADLILLEGIAYEGAGFWERLFIYLGVRIGGWIAWKK